MLNLICLNDGNSYLISKNSKVQNNMKKLFHKQFENNIMQLDNVWLRKEIIKIGSENSR